MITHEQSSVRLRAVFTGARFLVIAGLGVMAWYATRQLRNSGTLFIGTWQREGRGISDPLALLAPSLFLFVTPLVVTELFAVVSRVLALIFRFAPSASIYLGFINLGREGGQYRLPMYLLVLTLTVGVFYGSLARSADTWMVERRRYEVGADVTFEPGSTWDESRGTAAGSAFLLPSEEYGAVPGVRDVTSVVQLSARVPSRDNSPTLRLLALDPYEFPRIAYYREDFSGSSLQGLMNALAVRPNGLLVPSTFDAQFGLGGLRKVPLRIRLDEETVNLEFEIVGEYDYFPTMYDEEPVVVASKAYLDQQIGAIFPHRVWLRLEPGAQATQVLKDMASLAVVPRRTLVLSQLIAADQDRIERIGIFGMLSVCFLAAALFSTIGRVVYGLASMTGRSTRFALLQAIGMTRRQVLAMVSTEDALTIVYGLAGGLLLGLLASRFYVPFYAVTERPSLPIPPFQAHVDWHSALIIVIAMATVLLATQVSILLYVRQTKVFEALRMGARP